MNRSAHCVVMLLLVLALVGCASKPIRVAMSGDINARGTVKTVLATDNNASPVRARRLPGGPQCRTKIAIVDVDGLLVNRHLSGLGSLGENPVALLREKLDAAAADPHVRAVVLRINSPGGGVTAADIMRRDLLNFRTTSGKPVVACLMDVGAGGAYFLATAADVILAHPTTLTGGLGVVLNLYDVQDTMSQFNVVANTIRSGQKIDLGSPTRALEEDEEAILQRIAGEYHERLRFAVRGSRPSLTIKLPEAAIDSNDNDDPHAGTVFDGRVFTASEAQRLGLVDQIGYVDDALATARGLAGVGEAQTVVFRRNNDRALTAYDITPNQPAQPLLPISVPGLERAPLPTFLYLWQVEPLYEKYSGP